MISPYLPPLSQLFKPLMPKLVQPPSRLQGIVVGEVSSGVVGKQLSVNVNGNVIPARVSDPLYVNVGDAVSVDFVFGSKGQAEAWVTGRLSLSPRPSTGNVKTVPVGSTTITVTGSDGVDYTATFLSVYTPTVGDLVAMTWYAGSPIVQGKLGATPAPQVASATTVSAPPPPPSTGTNNYAASSSSTLWPPGGWGSWNGGVGVFQGSYGSDEVTGAWFYNNAPTQLKGKTIKAIRFTLGSRGGAGNHSQAVTVHLKSHHSPTQPGGDVSFGSGAQDVTAQPYQGPTVYNLNSGFFADIQNGGGIAIYGDPYANFADRNSQPNSGLLSIDWSS